MLYLIRDVLILHWAKASSRDDHSITSSGGKDKDVGDAPYLDLSHIWPMGVIDPKAV